METPTATEKNETAAPAAAEKIPETPVAVPPPQAAADGTPEARIAELEARLDALLAENRAMALERKWAAACAAGGIAHPALVEKWRPPSEDGIAAAVDDLKAFLDGFRKEQAAAAAAPPRPLAGSAQAPAARPGEASARARAALDGFRKDSQRTAVS